VLGAWRRVFLAMSWGGHPTRFLRRLCIVFLYTVILPGCQQLGPLALEQGRERYNEKIQNTSRDQLFANIIRVANSEPPLFMDVSEVDAAEAIQSTLTGGVSGIGTLLGLQSAGPAVPTSPTAGSLSTRVAPNQAGNVAGGVQYQESPTIRYLPLSGQPLIQQISTPISVVALVNLLNSDWPHLPILDFALDKIAPEPEDYYATLDAIVGLLDYSALAVTAEKSDATKRDAAKQEIASGTNITIQTSSQEDQSPDALVLYLRPYHPSQVKENIKITDFNGEVICDGSSMRGIRYSPLPIPPSDEYAAGLTVAKRNILQLWIRLLRVFSETQNNEFLTKFPPTWHTTADDAKVRNEIDAHLKSLADQVESMNENKLNESFAQLPRRIEVRTSSVPNPRLTDDKSTPRRNSNKSGSPPPPPNPAPIIATHSALGVLLSAPGAWIEFVSPSNFDTIYNRVPPSTGALPTNFYYALTMKDENSLCQSRSSPYCFHFDEEVVNPSTIARCVDDYVSKSGPMTTFSEKEDVKNYVTMAIEKRLGLMRRYLLIVVADQAPADAYVSYVRNGKSYYIDGRDVVSRRNFALLGQIMTMMAVPSQSSPLTPSISVGGSR
jgi:hypothetical protein